MWGVGCRECGISDDIARGAVRTVYWDTWVWVTTRTDHMSRMGSTSQVTNCDLLISETGKGGGAGRECPGHWLGTQLNLSCDTWARLGKGWKAWGNPYLDTGMVVSPDFRVGTVVHLCRVLKAWSPSGWNYLVILSFYTHGSMNNGLWELCYNDEYLYFYVKHGMIHS